MSEEIIDLWGDKPTETQPEATETTQETVTEQITPDTEAAEVVTEAVVETVPEVTERIVEKFIEKQPEFKDDYSKQIYESLISGDTAEVYKYLQEKNRDYQTISDYDVVKEGIRRDNPKWSEKDIAIELKTKYGEIPERKDLSDLDPEVDSEEYREAVAFNDRIDQKELLMSRDARDYRYSLEESKKNIELPKISKEQAKANEPTQDEVNEANRQWEALVDSEIPKLSDFKIKVGDEEVTYKISEADRKASGEFIKEVDGISIAQKRGWMDAQGNQNVLRIAEDMLKLENFDRIVASAATQMKTAAKKDLVADIKNIDLSRKSQSPELNVDLATKLWS